MFIQALVAYAHRPREDDAAALPPPMYARKPIRYLIVLDAQGRYVRCEDKAEPATPERRARRGQEHAAPDCIRSGSVIRPYLLADRPDYTLGVPRRGASPERVARCHAAYVAAVKACDRATGSPQVGAVCAYLARDGVDQVLGADPDPNGLVTFQVGDCWVIDLPEVQAFWGAYAQEQRQTEESVTEGHCLACGHHGPLVDRLPLKVKGLPGGDVALFGCNEAAYWSYGRDYTRGSPICVPCAVLAVQALSSLLQDPYAATRMGDVTYAAWTAQAYSASWALVSRPTAEQVQALLASVRSGRPVPVRPEAFYAAALYPVTGRVSLRLWIESTVGEIDRNVGAWFARQEVVRAAGEAHRPLGAYALARATVRHDDTPRKETVEAIVRAALCGTPVPLALLPRVVRRCQVEGDVRHEHAAVIKLILLSNRTQGVDEDTMVGLDEDNPSAAYQCGRLLAVLEQIQRAASVNGRATLARAYLGGASTTPGAILGRLLADVSHQMAKLRRDKRGAANALQERLDGVVHRLPAVLPAYLTGEEQAAFMMGYYHQGAADRAAARERSRARWPKQEGPPTTDDEDGTDVSGAKAPDDNHDDDTMLYPGGVTSKLTVGCGLKLNEDNPDDD